MIQRLFVRAGVPVALFSVAPMALADDPSAIEAAVNSVVSQIGATNTLVAAIGGAVLLVLVGIKVFKWVRRAM